MSPVYKLTYFNGRGLAETSRMIFAYADVEYEDCRFEREKWPEMKKQMPFGKVPALEVDGKLVGQSNAIARYLAKQFGLAGKNDWEALQIDSLVDALGDFKALLMGFRNETDPVKKEEKKQTLLNESIPFYMNRFEQVVKENNGYLVGGALTWADIHFSVALESFETFFGKDSLNHYPQLKELQARIFAINNIAKWIEKRPKTEF